MKLKGMIASAAVMAVAVFSVGNAQAAQYKVSYTSNLDAGGTANFSGVFTTTDVADNNGYFTVTSLTGQRDGLAASLLPVNGFFGNDNLFRPTPSYLDGNGISFVAGGNSYNSYLKSTLGLREIGVGTITNFTVSNVSAVPEPAMWLTMILGFSLVGGALRRRQKKVSTTVKFA